MEIYGPHNVASSDKVCTLCLLSLLFAVKQNRGSCNAVFLPDFMKSSQLLLKSVVATYVNIG